MKRRFLQGWGALLATTALAAASGCSGISNDPLSQQAYVWQRVWTPAVSDAARAAPVQVSGWRVLAAQAESTGEWRDFGPDLDALRFRKRPLIAVIRIDGQRPLADLERLDGDILRRLRAEPAGVWSGLEIDYDCPTRALIVYSHLLVRVRAALPREMPLSITVLPAWLRSDYLRDVLAAADSSVLQVHSVMDPHRGLFDPESARAWIDAFAHLTLRPFYVALPDYGSRITWDARGHLIAVTSENTEFTPDQAGQEVQADPVTVARFYSSLRQAHPRTLRGVVWFRLPVAGDQRIWSMRTWEIVMAGEPLVSHLTTRLERDASGATQLRLINDGNVDARLPHVMSIAVPCQAADGEGFYAVEHYPMQTQWRLSAERWLPTGHEARIGWIRCELGSGAIRIED